MLLLTLFVLTRRNRLYISNTSLNIEYSARDCLTSQTHIRCGQKYDQCDNIVSSDSKQRHSVMFHRLMAIKRHTSLEVRIKTTLTHDAIQHG